MTTRGKIRRSLQALLISTAVLGAVVGCGRSKEDIIQKSRDVSTRAELERVLGKPNEINKLGPVEQWTYTASNGSVVFLIVGDTVTLQAAAGPDDKKK
ncbi:MAG TPA: hypothetical protein VEH80_13035 [Candidatus Bathyarchaeia archaeon]|nr:hypothetical protein [Candidatus Bathyarchaeia archaeon]